MRGRRPAITTATTVALLGALAVPPARATFPGAPGVIATEADPCPLAPGGCPAGREPLAVDPDTGAATTLVAGGVALRAPQFSPEGDALLGLGPAGELLVADADGGDPGPVVSAGAPVVADSAAWEPFDGIAHVAGGQLRSVRPSSGRTTVVEDTGFAGARLVASLPDPASQPVVSFDVPRPLGVRARVNLYASLRPGSLGVLPPPLPGTDETSPDLSGADGRMALLRTRRTSAGFTTRVMVTSGLNLLPRTILTRTGRGRPPVESVTWSPDGARLAILAGGDLLTLAADGSDVRTVLDLPARRLVGRLSWQALP